MCSLGFMIIINIMYDILLLAIFLRLPAFAICDSFHCRYSPSRVEHVNFARAHFYRIASESCAKRKRNENGRVIVLWKYRSVGVARTFFATNPVLFRNQSINWRCFLSPTRLYWSTNMQMHATPFPGVCEIQRLHFDFAWHLFNTIKIDFST